jgi:hypothetical protein
MSSSEYWDKSKIAIDDTSTSNSAYSSPSPNTGIQAAKEQAKFNSWLIGEIEDLWTIADLDSGPVFDEEQIDAWLQSRKG